MSIRRVKLAFENQFVQIPNQWMRDKRLSRRARGLLAEIMTHEAGWEVTIESLADKGPEGRDAIRGAVKELEDAGYLRRERQKIDGKFGGIDYVLQAPTAPEAQLPIPSVGFSDVGKTYVGESDTKNTIFEEEHLEEHHLGAKAPGSRSRAAATRATSFPADFVITDAMKSWAEEKAQGIDLGFETEKFKDWHLSKGSTFKDWPAAWRTWMRNAVEFKKPAAAAVQEGTWW